MLNLVIALVIILLIWVVAAMFWASSIARHNPELREGAGQKRYGWRCPRCRNVDAPACRENNCGGALVWVQRDTRVKCARCHRNFIANPFLFRQNPGAKYMRCRKCGWTGKVTNWNLES